MGTTGGAIGGVVGTVGSFMQASQNNKSIKAANAAALRAQASNEAYLDVRRQSEQSKLGKAYSKYVAREAALSSSKGTYGSASSTAAQMSALANALIDSATVDFNTRAQKNASATQIGNQMRENSSRYQSPIFAAIQGGTDMFMSGYKLGKVIEEY